MNQHLNHVSSQEKTLTIQQLLLDKELEEQELEKQFKRRKYENDSLARLNIQKELKQKTKAAAREKALAKEALKDSEHRSINTYLGMSSLIMTVLIALIAIIYIYNYYIKRVNRRMRQKHQELRRTKDRANESSRMKVFFLQNMSHDIRTPLSTIINVCQMLTERIKKTKKDQELEDFTQIVSDNCQQLTTLVNTILEISLLESREKPIDMDQTLIIPIISDTIIVASNQNQRDIKLQTDIPADHTIYTNSTHLSIMLRQLLDNACCFAPEGPITVSVKIDDTAFTLSVEDHGPGIPHGKEEEIFKRFHKLDSFTSGTGLGLSLCRTIANTLKGNIYVDSSYTSGARFVFRLPLIDLVDPNQEEQEEDEKDSPLPIQRSKHSVLTTLLAIFVSATMFIPKATMAQQVSNIREQVLQLEQELEKETDPDKRLLILEHMEDLTNSFSRAEKKPYVEALLKAAREKGDKELILMTARDMANLNMEDCILKAYNAIKDMPTSEEKRATLTYIRCKEAQLQLRNMNEEKRSETLALLMKEAVENTQLDVYDQYLISYRICSMVNEQNYSALIEQYLRNLLKLCQQMHTDTQFLQNSALMMRISQCLEVRQLQECKEQAYKLLDNINGLENYYRSKNRPYRNFDLHKLQCYLFLGQCENVLTQSQMQNVRTHLKDIVTKNPDAMHNTEHDLLYHIITEKYPGTNNFLEYNYTRILQKKDSLTNLPEDQTYSTEYNEYALQKMAETYRDLGDTIKWITTKLIILDNLRRKRHQTSHVSFLHLKRYMEIQEAENRLEKLRQDNAMRLATKKLQETQEKNDSLAMEIKAQKAKEKELELQAESNKMQEERNAILHDKWILERKRQSFRLTGLISFAVISIIAIVYGIWQTDRLRKRRRELKKSERLLRHFVNVAKQNDKESTLFVQNISHELRTPMNVIVGFGHQLLESTKDISKEETGMYVKMLDENCEQIIGLIDGIIDIANLQSGQHNLNFTDINIKDTCDICLGNIRSSVAPGVELKLINHLPSNISTIHTDKARLQQLVTNLLANATKYCRLGHIHLILDYSPQYDSVLFQVEDTGIDATSLETMENSHSHRIKKEPSNKADDAYSDLNICRLIATRLGGKVYLDKAYTSGVRFVLQHPVRKSNTAGKSTHA